MPGIQYFSKVTKQHPKISLFIFLCIGCFIALKIYYHITPLPAKNWIKTNLEKIAINDPAKFSFALFSGGRAGSHIFRGILEQVDHDPEIAFAVNLGDTVFKGKKSYYKYFLKELEAKLGIPLLTVMGNNDLSGDGIELYRKIFGPSYYSFRVGKNFFIVIDNAGQNRFDNKQIVWLANELKGAAGYDSRIIFMHNPFYDPAVDNREQYISEDTSSKLLALFLKYNVSHIFASQRSGIYEGDLEGIPYTVTGGVGISYPDKRKRYGAYHFLKVNIEKGALNIERKEDFTAGLYKTRHHRYTPAVFVDHMARVHWFEISLLVIMIMGIIIYFIIRKRI
jgi:hypothetical protein